MAGKAVGRRSVGVAADAASRAGIHPSARRGRGGPRHARRDPDLDPITTLCEHEEYGRLADGSAARIVLAGYDEELLERRGIPDEAIDPGGALLLEPGTLATLGAAAGIWSVCG